MPSELGAGHGRPGDFRVAPLGRCLARTDHGLKSARNGRARGCFLAAPAVSAAEIRPGAVLGVGYGEATNGRLPPCPRWNGGKAAERHLSGGWISSGNYC